MKVELYDPLIHFKCNFFNTKLAKHHRGLHAKITGKLHANTTNVIRMYGVLGETSQQFALHGPKSPTLKSIWLLNDACTTIYKL